MRARPGKNGSDPISLWATPTVFRPDLLKGKVVLVSGGGSGIGRAVALLCARLGARVAICGRTPAKLEAVATFARGKRRTILALPADIREPEQVDGLYEQVQRKL